MAVFLYRAFLSGGQSNNFGKIAFVSSHEGSDEIYVMTVDELIPQRITPHSNGDSNDSDYAPVLSPDGKKIAYISSRDVHYSPKGTLLGNHQIYVANADGSNEIRITDGINEGWDIAWSPDSSKIAFSYYGERGDQIYIWDSNTGKIIRISYIWNEVMQFYLPCFQPSWAPSSDKIIAMCGSDFYLFDMAGNYLRITNWANSSDANNSITWTDPTYSPNGDKIAFVKKGIGTGYIPYIWIMDSNGNNQKMLSIGLHPIWSPDGSKIAFLMQYPDKTSSAYKICIMNADGSNVIDVAGDDAALLFGEGDYFAWSPDGAKLVFRGLYGIYIINSDGTGKIKIFDQEQKGFHLESGLSWSK
jgi:Tol biopolymer transport system component